MSDNNTGAFLTGFLLGSLAGAAAALLMTPQSGETTRLQLQERGIELRTQFDDLTAGIQERGKGLVEEKLPRKATTSFEEAAEAATGEGDATTVDEPEA